MIVKHVSQPVLAIPDLNTVPIGRGDWIASVSLREFSANAGPRVGGSSRFGGNCMFNGHSLPSLIELPVKVGKWGIVADREVVSRQPPECFCQLCLREIHAS